MTGKQFRAGVRSFDAFMKREDVFSTHHNRTMKAKLKTVTLTGADDTIDPERLIAISGEYPNAGFEVEWGILIGSQSGHRFPSPGWIRNLVALARPKVKLSLHICGEHLRQIAAGKVLHIPDNILAPFQRCQLNWHAEPQGDISRNIFQAFQAMDHQQAWRPEVIFQLDGKNEQLACECASMFAPRMAGLCDLSHGAGVLPEAWPECTDLAAAYKVGYAGGLGPENLKEELPKIHAVAAGEYWIDMETKIFDGLQFSLPKCCQVLEIVQDFIAGNP